MGCQYAHLILPLLQNSWGGNDERCRGLSHALLGAARPFTLEFVCANERYHFDGFTKALQTVVDQRGILATLDVRAEANEPFLRPGSLRSKNLAFLVACPRRLWPVQKAD